MNTTGRRQSIVQLRRMLRRLDAAHTNEESGCPVCSLHRLGAQLVEELEMEAEQLGSPDLRPGAASVLLAVEAVIGIIYTLDVQGADEQGRVMQALLDHVGAIVLDQLAHDEMSAAEQGGEPASVPPAGTRRGGGSIH
jgi:hypothetical protein